MMIRKVICGDDVAFVDGCDGGGGEQSRSCMYVGGPRSRATYYLERDAIADAHPML
jgi:hypothetical protein